MTKTGPDYKTGLTVGNASISAGVSPRGRLFQRIFWNPPCFESGKNERVCAGQSGLAFSVDGAVLRDEDLDWTVLENDYPRYRAEARLADGLKVEACAWAPISPEDCEAMFLPALCVRLTFRSEGESRQAGVSFRWDMDPALAVGAGEPERFTDGDMTAAALGDAFLAVSGAEAGEVRHENGGLELSGTFAVQGEKQVCLWLGMFPENHRWKGRLAGVQELCSHVRNTFGTLENGVDDWIGCLPRVGEGKIDRYLRWYSQAAVLLTKADLSGNVITMGYLEMNQRDSFWTSYVHLYFWPRLERQMIRESCEWQREDGKIPTTFLPVWEREYDIDINEYFCLRIARYYRWHRDLAFLKECWPHFLKSVEFLLAFDRDGDGLPEQDVPGNPQCFWADWKDVPGVVGRKLAPHFTLLWAAVLREGAYLAGELGEEEEERRFRALYAAAKRQIDLPVEEGGLWSDGCYRELWYDGSAPRCCLQDQTAGMAFDVVDPDRAAEIYRTLSAGENEAGIPETFPFRENMGYPPGVYHNGGIWPFLTFCDCMGRYRLGYWQDAERLIRKIGYYDLEAPKDWAPNEYLHGITLENCGVEIQGWSAALFGAVTHGAFQVCRSGEDTIEVLVNFPNREFETEFLLPEPFGRITIGRKDGELFCRSRSGASVTAVERNF